MEIAHLDDLDNIYIVKFKRLAGETGSYKDVSNRVLNNMQLFTTSAYWANDYCELISITYK